LELLGTTRKIEVPMAWKWLTSRRRKPIVRNQRSQSLRLRVERLEDRFLPASGLDAIPIALLQPSGACPLQGGGSVGPLTTVQFDGSVQPVTEGNSQTATTSGQDANGIPFQTQTTWSYVFTVSGSLGSGDTSSYQQTYNYSFDAVTTLAAPGAGSVHDWWTYQYVFAGASSPTESHFTMISDLSHHQTGATLAPTTAEDGSTTAVTWIWQFDETYHREISNNSALFTGEAQGGDVGSSTATATYSGAGSYGRPAGAGYTGTISGTVNAAGMDGANGSFAASFARDWTGAVTQSGSWNQQGSGWSHQDYSGGGSYAASDANSSTSGTATESGADNANYLYSSNSSLGSDGTWQVAGGTGGGGGNGFADSGYTGGGAYAYAAGTGTVSGTFTQNGNTHSDYNYTFGASPATGGAWSFSGSGTANWRGEDHSTYTGSGTYGASDANSSSSGIIIEGGAANSNYQGAAGYSLASDGTWLASSGTSGGGGNGFSLWSYIGGGAYGYAAGTGAVTGTFTQNGFANSDYNYSFSGSQSFGGAWGFTGGGTANSSGEDHSTYNGGGTYLNIDANSVSGGTITENGADNSDYHYTTGYTIGSDGNWQAASGTGGGGGNGLANWSYNGGGVYGYPAGTGTVSGSFTQNGRTHSDYNYTFGASPATAGAWTFTGNGTVNSSGEDHSTYNGSGAYGSSDANSSSSGTIIEGGANNSNYQSTAGYSMANDGTWLASGGTSSGGGNGFSLWSYIGGGGYGYAAGAVTGTFTQNGFANSDYNYSFSGSQSFGGAWGFTGGGTANSSGEDHSTYNGGGTYLNIDANSVTGGTITENGADNSDYHYTTGYTIGSDGNWQAASGTGGGGGNGLANWSYNGGGVYGYAAGTGAVTGSFTQNGRTHSDYNYTFDANARGSAWSFGGSGAMNWNGEDHSTYNGSGSYGSSDANSSSAGTIVEGGADNSNYQAAAGYWMASDGTWQASSGTSSGGGNGFTLWSYNGGGSYGYAADTSAVSGTFTQNGFANSNYNYSFAGLSVGGAWMLGGSGTANAGGEDHSTYDGGGAYGTSDANSSSGGTIAENGANNSDYRYTTVYTVGSDGNWQVASGNGSGGGYGFADWSYDGGGAYNYTTGDSSVSGTFTQHGFANSDYSYTFGASQAAGGAWSFSGSGTVDGTGEDHSTYSGDGGYGTSDGSALSSGSITENGADNSHYTYSTSYSLGSDSTWQVSSGTGSGGGDGFADWSYDGSGTYSYGLADNSGTVTGGFTQNGEAHTDYNYSFAATQNSAGAWAFTGNGTTNWTGEDHDTYEGDSAYSTGFIQGTWSENGGDNSSYDYTLDSTLNSAGVWTATDGSGGSEGDGHYDSSYVGDGSNIVDSTTTLDDTTTVTTLNETGHENGHDGYGYTFATTSDFANGAWTTTGSMTTIGNGAADWWYVGSYTFTQDSNSTWNDSFSSGNSDSHVERTETADANGHGSYDFTAVTVLAANGSVTTTETLTGGGESHGHYHLTGSGYADSTSDTSDGDFSSHTELHSTFTQTDNENFDSSWEADLTVVITSSGTVTTGTVSGSDDAGGAATFIAHGNGVSDSSTSGSEFSSGSHNDWTSDTTASDGYDYHGAWSDVYANGTLTSSASVTNHIWGSLTTGSTSNWSTTSTTLDADGNPVTVTTSGGDSHGTGMSYDDTFSTGGFATTEFSKSQPGSYAGAKPGGTTAMSEPWLSSDSGRPTGDESFFGTGKPGNSGGSSGDIVLCSGPGQIVGGAGNPVAALVVAQGTPGERWWHRIFIPQRPPVSPLPQALQEMGNQDPFPLGNSFQRISSDLLKVVYMALAARVGGVPGGFAGVGGGGVVRPRGPVRPALAPPPAVQLPRNVGPAAALPRVAAIPPRTVPHGFVGPLEPGTVRLPAPANRLALPGPGPVLNRNGLPYPTIIDPRTGRPIPFPETIVRTPAASRVPWNDQLRRQFIDEWRRRGFADPPGGWGNYDIHHITPREWGGTNAFGNLIPVERGFHQQSVTPWWNNFSGR
jgi:hypothetical protein